MRSDDMVRLGVACAELAVRGEDYRRPLADGMLRILDVDAGIGVAQWDVCGDVITPDSLVTVAGTPPLTMASAEASFTVVAEHPLLSRSDFANAGAARVSDLTCLPSFWEQPAWQLVHGINDGRYPAMVSLGSHPDRSVFVGAQRRRRDFSDDDMEVLDAIREPLTSALTFRAQLDRATRKLRGLRVVDDPATYELLSPYASMEVAKELRPYGAPMADSMVAVRLCPRPIVQTAFTADPLTTRESEVLALVAAGWTNLRVGRTLGITERTVRKHLGNVYDKLGVSGRTSATAWWLTHSAGQGTKGQHTAGQPTTGQQGS